MILSHNSQMCYPASPFPTPSSARWRPDHAPLPPRPPSPSPLHTWMTMADMPIPPPRRVERHPFPDCRAVDRCGPGASGVGGADRHARDHGRRERSGTSRLARGSRCGARSRGWRSRRSSRGPSARSCRFGGHSGCHPPPLLGRPSRPAAIPRASRGDCSGFLSQVRTGNQQPLGPKGGRPRRNRQRKSAVHARPKEGDKGITAETRGSKRPKARLVFFLETRGRPRPPLKSPHGGPLAGPQRANTRQHPGP